MIEAKVFLPLVESYTAQDFAAMDSFDAERNKAWGPEKIVGEKRIGIVSARTQKQFKRNILSLCAQNEPLPLFVKLLNGNTLDRTFIAPRRFREESRNSIVEHVDYLFNKKARAIIKFIESHQSKYGKLVDHFLVEKTGTDRPWELNHTEKQREELAKMVGEFGRPLVEKMYTELADKFRLDKNRLMTRFRDNRGLAYRTSAEAKKERLVDGHAFSLNSILNDYIEEQGRFIAKGFLSETWIFRYREQIHPELLAPDEIGTSSMSFGGGIPWGRASSKQIMHAENSKLISCPPPGRKKSRAWMQEPREIINQFGVSSDSSEIEMAPSPGQFVDSSHRLRCTTTALVQRGGK